MHAASPSQAIVRASAALHGATDGDPLAGRCWQGLRRAKAPAFCVQRRRSVLGIQRPGGTARQCPSPRHPATFSFACSSVQYSMSKRSASLIGVKVP